MALRRSRAALLAAAVLARDLVGLALAAAAGPPVEALPAGATVCVTGASGYIASVLVVALKDAGYTVVGTVRSTEAYAAEPAFEGVELLRADLLDAESFRAPFSRCQAVMHTASPFWFPRPDLDPDRDFVQPALEGTRNVLRVAYEAGVRRVVVTSSTGAITPQFPWMHPGEVPGETREFTEDDWSLDSTKENQPYRYSKRMAEEAVWDFSRSHPDMHVAVINPSGTLGPLAIGRSSAESIQVMKGILQGGDGGAVSNFTIGWVDVRDVALAHIRAMELPAAHGQRFIVSSARGVSVLELAQWLREGAAADEFRAFPLPTRQTSEVAIRPMYSNARARDVLGLSFRPLPTTVVEMARDLVRRGVVQPPPAANGAAPAEL